VFPHAKACHNAAAASLGSFRRNICGAQVLRGALKTPGQAKNVAIVGSTALVADHMSEVDIIDVSNAARPVNRGSFFVEGYAAT
jgi:hypothetical protein